MSIIGDLVVRFGAQTRGAESGFRRMRGLTGSLVGSFRRVTGAVLRFGTALTGVAGAGGITGFAYMIRQEMKAIDVTAKLSDRVGISTERLVGLQHAGSIAGMGVEQTNKSTEMFVRRIGELYTGSGEASRGLDLLGIRFEDLADKTPADAIEDIMERIRQLPTESERAAAAYFFFGRSGQRMLNMIMAGVPWIREMTEEAQRLGIAFDREAAAGVEKANDAMNRMGKAFRGFATQAAIQLAPFVELLATELTGALVSGREELTKNAKATDDLRTKYGLVGVTIFGVTDIVQDAALAWAKLSLEFHKYLYQVAQANEQVGGIAKWTGPMADWLLPEGGAEMNTLRETIEGMKLTVEELEGSDWSQDLESKLADLQAAFDKAGAGAEGMGDLAEDAFERMGIAAETPIDKAQEFLDKVAKDTAQAGLDPLWKQYEDITSMAGFDDPMLAERMRGAVNEWETEMKRLEAKDFAAKLREDLETPAETALRKLEEIQRLQLNFPDLMPDELANRAGRGILADLQDQLADGEGIEEAIRPQLQFAAAAERGTAEAYSAILRGMSARGGVEEEARKTSRNTATTAKTVGDIYQEVQDMHADQDEGMDIPGG